MLLKTSVPRNTLNSSLIHCHSYKQKFHSSVESIPTIIIKNYPRINYCKNNIFGFPVIFPNVVSSTKNHNLPCFINYLQKMFWTGITIPESREFNYTLIKGGQPLQEERELNEDFNLSSPLLQPSSPNKKPTTFVDKIINKSKELFSEYGFLGIGVYCFTSCLSIGGFYFLIKNGLDIKSIFEWFNISLGSFWDSAGTIAMAYAIHKLILPIRIAITIFLTRFLKRILHK